MYRIIKISMSLGMALSLLLFSCESDNPEPEMSAEQFERHLADRLEINSQLFVRSIELLTTIEDDSFKIKKKESEDEEALINNYTDLATQIFDSAYRELAIELGLEPGAIRQSCSNNLKQIGLAFSKTTLDVSYEKALNEALADTNHKKWVIIESATGEENRNLEIDRTSLKSLLVDFNETLLNANVGEEKSAIDKLLANNNVPPVLVGLLLPAVQHASLNPDAEDEYEKWFQQVFSGYEMKYQYEIRHVYTIGYLASMDYFLSETTRKQNIDYLSTDFFQERFVGMVTAIALKL